MPVYCLYICMVGGVVYGTVQNCYERLDLAWHIEQKNFKASPPPLTDRSQDFYFNGRNGFN